MSSFAAVAFAYPTAIYSTLLGIVLCYWLLAMFGLVDFEHGGLELDGDVGDIGTLASYLVAFGLGGVPFSVVVSLLTLIAWTLCSLAALWLLPLVPTVPLRLAAGTAVLLGAFALALPITARAVRPMRRLFVTHGATTNAELVGQRCRILTNSVDERFGRAEVDSRGSTYNIRVVADTPNTLTRGASAIVIDYDPANARYRVQAAD
ncbi:ubiquinone biosynthesis protein [Azoarcus communis]|uniref:ubiquinone biosynthesis protein n=1 Tax=Parazoarcus communis TaxID=41977 RepID=UPI0014593558|nr:ubiquinone biosynthesis protein [Parazoarcus communis]NMG46550.1 ubiquinone biosynthesis protein [Parazoarcus communis]